MKHRITDPGTAEAEPALLWLPLLDLAQIEISSESGTAAIENALALDSGSGWEAGGPGIQIIRLRFDPPCTVRQVRLVIRERERSRTQELTLRVAFSAGAPWREVVRQQFNFSPSGATQEVEDYKVDLPPIAALELVIIPDISGGDAVASLEQLRLA